MTAQQELSSNTKDDSVDFSIMKDEFLHALLNGKNKQCTILMQSYLDKKISIQQLYENIFKFALYDVGELWEYNKISVATEHMASAIVETLMNQLYPKIVSNFTEEKTVITSCVKNEMHQIGIRMISDIFEMNGWNALYLGSDTPDHELIRFVKEQKPNVFAISASLSFNIPNVVSLVDEIHKHFPDLLILVGGQAFNHGFENIFKNRKNVIIKSDIKSIELFIKNY